MRYRLDYLSAATRAIEKLPRSIQQRVMSRLELLADNPRPPGSVKLTGEDAYRIRVGDYRISTPSKISGSSCWLSTSVIAARSIGVDNRKK